MICQFELLDTRPDADGKFTIFCPNCTAFVRKSKPSVKTHRLCTAPIDSSNGVGACLKRILSKFDIRFSSTCKCREYALIMNQWGPEGCQENFQVIVGWLRKEYKTWGWGAKIANAVKIGVKVDFPVNPFDPFASFINEAILQAQSP